MTASTLKPETYLPDTSDRLARLHDFFKAHERPGLSRLDARYFLAGPDDNDQVELPTDVYRLLRQVVDALQRGLAVTVAPSTTTLTTQQAADLLGVSRPTVIKLLDEQKIPFERAGTHRRILLRDLLDYRDRRRAEQYAALEATAVDIDADEDITETLQHLREARKAVAQRRGKYPS